MMLFFSSHNYLLTSHVSTIPSPSLSLSTTELGEIQDLGNKITNNGYTKAVATWVHEQLSMDPSSHQKYFRERMNPRAVESYMYGIPGPKACEKNARFRRFAFTYMDVALSRGMQSFAGNNGHPYTPMNVENDVTINGLNYTVIKFGGDVRTVLQSPLEYYDDYEGEAAAGTLEANMNTTVLGTNSVSVEYTSYHSCSSCNVYIISHPPPPPPFLSHSSPLFQYTICAAEEVVGTQLGPETYYHLFQVLVGDLCTPSITNRGGVADGLGDGSVDSDGIRPAGQGDLAREYDVKECEKKCTDSTLVKYITIGNPPVELPSDYSSLNIDWVDLSSLSISTGEIVNINSDSTHDSSWLLKTDLPTCNACTDNTCSAGVEIPDPAGLAWNDLESFDPNRGKL